MKKEAVNVKGQGGIYGRVGGRKGWGEMIELYYNLKKKGKIWKQKYVFSSHPNNFRINILCSIKAPSCSFSPTLYLFCDLLSIYFTYSGA